MKITFGCLLIWGASTVLPQATAQSALVATDSFSGSDYYPCSGHLDLTHTMNAVAPFLLDHVDISGSQSGFGSSIGGIEYFAIEATDGTVLASTTNFPNLYQGQTGTVTFAPIQVPQAFVTRFHNGGWCTFGITFNIFGRPTPPISGFDVSYYTGAVQSTQWKQIAQSTSFVIVQAYGGGGKGSPLAALQLSRARAAGLKTAAYCLLNFETPDGKQRDSTLSWSGGWQIQQCIDAIGEQELPYLNFIAIDVEESSIPITLCEETSGGSQTLCIDRIQEAIDQVLSLFLPYRIRPVIYTTVTAWQHITGNSTIFSAYPLWDRFNDFLPDLTMNGTENSGCPSSPAPIATTYPWHPYGGWLSRVGKQYNLGCPIKNFGLEGSVVDGILLDLDVFAAHLFFR